MILYIKQLSVHFILPFEKGGAERIKKRNRPTSDETLKNAGTSVCRGKRE